MHNTVSLETRRWVLPRYATTLLPGVVLGPIIYWLYRELVGLLNAHASLQLKLSYPILVSYAIPAIGLIGLLLLHRTLAPGISLVGRFTLRHLIAGCAAVVAAYALSMAVTLALGFGRELSMVFLGYGMTHQERLLMYLMLFVLPPIVEEIAFRHFILGALPYRRNLLVLVLAIAASAVAFMVAHFKAYTNWPTHGLMLALGVIFATSRVMSGGLLLPIALHSFAIGTALTLDKLWVTFFS